MTFLAALGTILLLLLVSAFFISSGFVLWRLVFSDDKSKSFLLGASFFTGAIFYITLFGIFESVFNSAHAAVCLSLVTLSTISLKWFPRTYINTKYCKTILLGLGVFVFWLIINTVHALQPLSSVVLTPETTHYSLGFIAAEHSFRLENIIVTMAQIDALPYINQNSAQAILAFIPNVFGFDAPQFSIVVWHSLVIFFAALLVYGCARYFLSRKAALVPTAFVMLGNTAISYQYISITDSGHAILLARNYEVVIGLASFLLLGLVVRKVLLTELTPIRALYIFVTAFAWSVVGGHYTLIFLALSGLMFWYHRTNSSFKKLANSLSVLILGCILGTLFMGGLFAFNAPVSNIPGVKSVKEGSSESPLSLRAFRTVEAEYHTRLKLVYLVDGLTGNEGNETPDVIDVETNVVANEFPVTETVSDTNSLASLNFQLQALITNLKTNPGLWDVIRFIRSLQLIILPLWGLVVGYWLFYRLFNLVNLKVRELYFFTVPIFLGGWVISSVFLVYGQYGETSRFFAPGISAGMFLLGLIIVEFINKESVKLRIVAAVVAFFVIVPVVFDYVTIGLVGNFVLPTTQALIYDARQEGYFVALDDVLTMKERFNILISPGILRGEDL